MVNLGSTKARLLLCVFANPTTRETREPRPVDCPSLIMSVSVCPPSVVRSGDVGCAMSVGVGSMCDLGVCVFGCGRDDSRQRDGTRMREVDLRDVPPPSTPAFVNAKHAQERPTNTTARPHRPPNNHHLTVTISPFNGHISTSRGPCGWSQVPTCPRNCQHSQTRPYDPNQVGQPRASWCSARRTCM